MYPVLALVKYRTKAAKHSISTIILLIVLYFFLSFLLKGLFSVSAGASKNTINMENVTPNAKTIFPYRVRYAPHITVMTNADRDTTKHSTCVLEWYPPAYTLRPEKKIININNWSPLLKIYATEERIKRFIKSDSSTSMLYAYTSFSLPEALRNFWLVNQ